MHDPSTVAFDIRIPIKTKRNPYGIYLLTIWHNDPCKFRFPDGTAKLGGGGDDSCGWSRPMYSERQIQEMIDLAKSLYSEVLPFTHALEIGSANGFTGPDPSRFETIYWCWRAIKAYGKPGWRFGRKVTVEDYNHIMELASAPGDNIGWVLSGVKDERTFIDFFLLVWKNYMRSTRPWHKHPRWHIHHWSFQFHPWQSLFRRHLKKCSKCGSRGSDAWYNTWSGRSKDSWCDKCEGSVAQHKQSTESK